MIIVLYTIIIFCILDILKDYSIDEVILHCVKMKECLMIMEEVSSSLQIPIYYGITVVFELTTDKPFVIILPPFYLQFTWLACILLVVFSVVFITSTPDRMPFNIV